VKKIFLNIPNVLLFNAFLLASPFYSQLDSATGAKLSSDSRRYFMREEYFSDNPKQSKLEQLIDSTLESFMMSSQNCGISIGISHKGKNYFYNYGEIKRDSKIPPDSNSIYEIGSITKTFTGLVLAKAVTENKLKLEDDIRKYLQGKFHNLTYYGKIVRIKHLASHSSGLPRIPENLTTQSDFDKTNPYKNYTKNMLLSYLGTVKLKDEPGSEFEYSSLGMALLGLILEEVYQSTFENLMKEKIIIPFNLQNTGLTLSEDQNKKFASGYDENGEETNHWEMGIFAPAGALKSCTNDMLKYLELNRKEAEKALVLAHLPAYKGSETVGLAWFIKKTKQGNTMIWHNGATYGSGSFSAFIREKESSLIILTNSETSVDFLGIAILNYLQK